MGYWIGKCLCFGRCMTHEKVFTHCIGLLKLNHALIMTVDNVGLITMLQDRMMVTITCMLVVANVQSSVGESIPKTSYFKMIDYFLIYSLNIIILVMVYHTYMTAHIAEDFAPNQDDMEMERVNTGL